MMIVNKDFIAIARPKYHYACALFGISLFNNYTNYKYIYRIKIIKIFIIIKKNALVSYL